MIVELTVFTTMVVHHLIIGSGLLLLLLVVSRFKQINAETKSWLWLSAFFIATIYPASLLVKEQPAQSINTEETKIVKEITNQMPKPAQQVVNQYVNIDLNNASPEWHLPSYFIFKMSTWLISLFFIWLMGSLWRTIQVCKSHFATRQLLTMATPLSNDSPISRLTKTPILISQQTTSPLVTGLLHPVIVLPHSLYQSLSSEKMTPVVLHELAHIQRKDIWFGVFQELLAIIFWWSPIMRVFNRHIHLNREMACDIRAANQMNNGKQYAQSLLDCAKLMLARKQNILAMSLFSHKKDLNLRIEQVLNMNSQIKPKSIIIATLCLMMSVATIATAQNFAPKINLAAIEKQSKFLTHMSREQGELLLAAVTANNIEVIQTLVENGLDINTPIIGDGTALIIAVRNKNIPLVEALIGLGADVNQASRGDGNPLIAAAMVNSIAAAEILVSYGADINGSVRGDETPLINATRNGYLAMTIWLVEHGADVNLSIRTGASDGFELRSPLNMARDPAVRDYLLSQNAVE